MDGGVSQGNHTCVEVQRAHGGFPNNSVLYLSRRNPLCVDKTECHILPLIT
jgi:hypothetical protein